MEDNNAMLQLGTKEVAVISCVNMLAVVTSTEEKLLAYWLDLYYQVRRAYEIEQGEEEDPQLIRLEDLYPIVRDMIRETLKSTAKEKNREKEREEGEGAGPGERGADAVADQATGDRRAGRGQRQRRDDR